MEDTTTFDKFWKLVGIFAAGFCVAVLFNILNTMFQCSDARNLIANGDYDKAYDIVENLNSDEAIHLKEQLDNIIHYEKGKELYKDGYYSTALGHFAKADGYLDADMYVYRCVCHSAKYATNKVGNDAINSIGAGDSVNVTIDITALNSIHRDTENIKSAVYTTMNDLQFISEIRGDSNGK